jgi:hypothetical protein
MRIAINPSTQTKSKNETHTIKCAAQAEGPSTVGRPNSAEPRKWRKLLQQKVSHCDPPDNGVIPQSEQHYGRSAGIRTGLRFCSPCWRRKDDETVHCRGPVTQRNLVYHYWRITRITIGDCATLQPAIQSAWPLPKAFRRESMKTHYETLGIPKNASAAQIKASYRILVKMHHPDKFPEGAGKAEAEERLRAINAAYAVLSKAASRASYDDKLNPAASPSEAEPEHCARCGKPTTYWHTTRKAPLCHACMAKAAGKRNGAGA